MTVRRASLRAKGDAALVATQPKDATAKLRARGDAVLATLPPRNAALLSGVPDHYRQFAPAMADWNHHDDIQALMWTGQFPAMDPTFNMGLGFGSPSDLTQLDQPMKVELQGYLPTDVETKFEPQPLSIMPPPGLRGVHFAR